MSIRARLGGLLRGARARGLANAPAYWREYVAAAAKPLPRSTPVSQADFVVLDTETTGPDHRTDRVVSFGAVRIRGTRLAAAESVDWRIRADLPSAAESIEVHGLLQGDLEDAMTERRFVERLVGYVGDAIVVAYRPGFDMAVINRTVRAHTGGRLSNRTLDVFDLGMRVDYPVKPPFVNPEGYRLDVLCDRYDVEQPARHTAIGDAFATAELFLKLRYRLEAAGTRTLGDLLRRYG